MTNNNALNRITGLLIIEARNSNPNGDPDNEGEPRQRSHDKRGMISGVSFKRKLRDLVEITEGPVWHSISQDLNITSDGYKIVESRGRNLKEIGGLKKQEFQDKYWDARVFGNTLLESMKESRAENKDAAADPDTHFIRAGAVQFGNGISIAPIRIELMTNTNKSGVQEGKDRGMAPLGYRVVEHGVYAMPFFLNPTAAFKSGCTSKDIELLQRLIPLAYSHNLANGRTNVGLRHAWLVEHQTPLGSCSDFAILDALTPKKRVDPNIASTSWEEYDVPSTLPDALQQRVKPLMDLVMP